MAYYTKLFTDSCVTGMVLQTPFSTTHQFSGFFATTQLVALTMVNKGFGLLSYDRNLCMG